MTVMPAAILGGSAALTSGNDLGANLWGRGLVNTVQRELVEHLRGLSRGVSRSERSALIRGLGHSWSRMREAGLLARFCTDLLGNDMASALERAGTVVDPKAHAGLTRLLTEIHVKGGGLALAPKAEAA